MAARSSQVVIEGLVQSLGHARASQVVIEGLVQSLGHARASQVVIEVLVPNVEPMTLSIFPNLVGQGFSFIKRPVFSTNMQEHVSGRELGIGYWSQPLWEWDITWEFLPDAHPNFSGTTASDLKTLIAFFIDMQGRLTPFLFEDPDDYTVTGQQIGTGDGTTTAFGLTRQLTQYATAEPIGQVNTGLTFNVYVNSVLQASNTYTLNTATPLDNYIQFNSAPASGAVITVDMSYYFLVRFKDDSYDFEKFMYKLWSQKKITLRSQRQGAST